MRAISITILTLCHALLVLSASLRINIPASSLLPNPNTLPASTHATLLSSTGPPQRAILRKGNYLLFPSIPTSGSHLLSIFTRDYTFAQYRIDISPSSSSSQNVETTITGAYETYPGTHWSDHGIDLTSSPSSSSAVSDLTISAKLLTRKSFYDERQGFSVLTLLKNPMLLMGLVALVFVWGMPKLLENMDPEMRAEYEEMQKKKSGVVNKALQAQAAGGGAGTDSGFDMAGWLAGKSAGTTSSTTNGGGDIRERKR